MTGFSKIFDDPLPGEIFMLPDSACPQGTRTPGVDTLTPD